MCFVWLRWQLVIVVAMPIPDAMVMLSRGVVAMPIPDARVTPIPDARAM
jgi:hypothetical protein